MNNDLISREELKKAFKAWKTMDDYYHDTDCNDIPFSEAFDLIDNAPTVEQPNCSHCDYWNFSQKMIDSIVEVMTKYGMESVEDLQKELNRLKGGEQE